MNKELIKITEKQIKEMAEVIKQKYYSHENNCNFKIYENKIEFYKNVYPEEKVVYIKQDNFGRVKIGVSCDSQNRNKQLSDTSGLIIEDIYDSEYCTNWSKIENNMHKIFEKHRIKGEWFNIEPQEAIKELKKQKFRHDVIVESLNILDFNKIDRLYKIVQGGNFHGLELEEDDQFTMNCTKEQLKNRICEEIKDLCVNYNKKKLELPHFCSVEDELYSYVKLYFSIFENKIAFKKFTIEKSCGYDPYAYLNDNTYGDRLHIFALAMGYMLD